jgi:LuxR family transcriptional regulator, maltose regulon positive regulatory protein
VIQAVSTDLDEAIDTLLTALPLTGRASRILALEADGCREAAALAHLGRGLRRPGGLLEAALAVPPDLHELREVGYRLHMTLAAAERCEALALHGELDQARDCLAEARLAAVAPEAPLVDTALSMATALLAVATGDEGSATTVLTECFTRHPLGMGLSARLHRRNLTAIYVLVPTTRQAWDEADLPPSLMAARDLARAVVAVRDGGPRLGPPPSPASVHRHLPPSWEAELATGAEGGRRCDLPTDPPPPRLELRLLGPIELRRDGALVDAREWRRERVRSLLAYLVLHGPVSRSQVCEDLWPRLAPDAQSRNLRVTLSYLLRVLEPARGPRDPSCLIRQHGANLSLRREGPLAVDVWELDRQCDEAVAADRSGSSALALARGLQAADLWQSEPTGLSEAWAVPLVEQRRRSFTEIVIRAGELLLDQGDVGRAVTLAERALDADPWLDRAHRLVVTAHRTSGDELATCRALSRYHDAVRDLGLGAGEASRLAKGLLDQAQRHAAASTKPA